MYQNAFTVLTRHYRCNANCPYCRAKMDKKFEQNDDEDFSCLEEDISFLNERNFHFEKFILSGNGEPTMYRRKDLQTICNVVNKYEHMFDRRRLYTNGNPMMNDELFSFINSCFNEYVLTVISLNLELDRHIRCVGDYWNTKNIHKAQSIKLDIGKTKFIEQRTFCEDLDILLRNHPNISGVLLMKLKSRVGGVCETPQSLWMNRYNMDMFELQQFDQLLKDNYNNYNGNEHQFVIPVSDGREVVLSNGGGGENKKIEPWLYWDSEKRFTDHNRNIITF